MRLPNIEWLWLIVFVIAWLWPTIRKVRSGRHGDEPPPTPKPKLKPKQRPQTRRVPVGQKHPSDERQELAVQIRDLVAQIRRGGPPPAPAPVVSSPILESVSAPGPMHSAPPLIGESDGAQPLASKPPHPSPRPTAKPQPTPASVWAEALRDKQNLRRIIIAAEIIGPPKGG